MSNKGNGRTIEYKVVGGNATEKEVRDYLTQADLQARMPHQKPPNRKSSGVAAAERAERIRELTEIE